MKLALLSTLSLAAVATLAVHAPEAHADDAAVTAAKAWLTPVLAGGAVTPTPTKAAPLDYVVDGTEEACSKLSAGKVITASAAPIMARCLADSFKSLGDPSIEAQWQPKVALKAVTRSFKKKVRSKMTKAAKGTTIVAAEYMGDGITLSIYLAVKADGTVRAVWMQDEIVE